MAGLPPSSEASPKVIAEVAIETSLVHLDKVFDYSIPSGLIDDVKVGSRVRVRFAGALTNGWVLAIKEESDHRGRLLPVERVPGAVPPLIPPIAELARHVATRYAGTFTDVLRAAIPTRHAATENSVVAALAATENSVVAALPAAGSDGLDVNEAATDTDSAAAGPAAAENAHERSLWMLPAGTDHWQRLADRIVLARQRGGVIAVVPDATDVVALAAELKSRALPGDVVVLTADAGPAKRWRAFLQARLGLAGIVIGTRAAVFAPLHDLAQIVLWDDGDESHREPHAPYWHAREVAVLRSAISGCGVVLACRAVSVEAAYLAESGWLTIDDSSKAVGAARPPMVRATRDDSDASARDITSHSRIPSAALTAIREGLARGSVLVSVPRRGFVSVLSCANCKQPARCPSCDGYLEAKSAQDSPTCRRCGWGQWQGCPSCGQRRLRAVRVGAERTGHELGRAFPGAPLVLSNGDHRVTEIPRKPSLVVATHGCEPFDGNPYAAVVLLDVVDVVNRPFLNAEADALRRFAHAASLAGPSQPVVVVADSAVPVVQALIRHDYLGWSRRAIAERESAHLPPTALMFSLVGPLTAVTEFLDSLELPAAHRVLGPAAYGDPDPDVGQQVRSLVVVPRSQARAVVAQVREVIGIRSARKAAFVRVVIDPDDV